MSVHANCKCGYQSELPDFYAGKNVRCPQCSSVIAMPSAAIYDLNDVDVAAIKPLPLAPARDLPPPIASAASASTSARRAHPGAHALGEIDVESLTLPPLAPQAAAATPATPAAAPGPFAKAIAGPDIFNRPRNTCAGTMLMFLNLGVGTFVALVTLHPILGMAVSGIWAMIALMAASHNRRRGGSIFVPVLFLIFLSLLGVRHAKNAHRAGYFGKKEAKVHNDETLKNTHSRDLQTFVRGLTGQYEESELREDLMACIDDYRIGNPDVPSWLRKAYIEARVTDTKPLHLHINILGDGVQARINAQVASGAIARGSISSRTTSGDSASSFGSRESSAELAGCYQSREK